MAGIILGIKSFVITVIVTIEARSLKSPSTLVVCPKYGIHSFAHKDCNRYYECSNGILFAKFCDPDKLYDIQKQKCLQAYLVKCDEDVEESWESYTMRTRRRSDSQHVSNVSDIVFNVDGCPINERIRWKIPHAKCEKYYECKHGTPKVRTCPPGKLFDIDKLKCVKSSRVRCEPNYEERTEPDEGKLRFNEIGCPDDPNVEWKVPHKNCNQYYQCKDGNLEPHRCPINMVYNIDTRACDSLASVDCANRFVNTIRMTRYGNKGKKRSNRVSDDAATPNSKEIVNKYTLQVRAEEVCADPNANGITLPFAEPNGYYLCADGEAVLKYCSAGLQYNHKVQKCDWFDVDSQDTFNTNAEDTCLKESQNNYENTLLPHENCNQYYKCVKNIPVPRYCQSGYLFDTKLSRCDWAANVVCGLRSLDGDK